MERGYFYTGPQHSAQQFEEYIREDDDPEFRMPTHKVVCDRCRGEGTHDAWSGGMTSDEMDEQGPEFFEDYMSGMYSVPCEDCNGKNVVDEVDESRLSPERLTEWHSWEQDRCDSNQESAMGC